VFADLDKEAANNVWKSQLAKPADEDKQNKKHDDDD
jgi:Lon-like ATP-dependent protease